MHTNQFGRWVSPLRRVSDLRDSDKRLFSNLHIVGSKGNRLIILSQPGRNATSTYLIFLRLFIYFVSWKGGVFIVFSLRLFLLCGQDKGIYRSSNRLVPNAIDLYLRLLTMDNMAQSTLRFIFISDPEKPVVTLKVPNDMLFQEALVVAAKRQKKDASILTATFPGGTPITSGTVKEIAEKSTNIHVIDPSIVG